MNYAITLLTKLLSIIIITLIGYLIGKKGIIKKSEFNIVAAILNKVALPALVLTTYISVKLTKDTLINASYLILAALIIYFINLTYISLLAKKLKLNDHKKSVFINAALHSNSGFLAFPLLLAVFGEIGLFYGTVYFMVDNILLFTTALKRFQKGTKTKQKLAIVTWAIIIALPLMIISNVFEIDFTNNFVFDAIYDVSKVTIPLAFLFIGMVISQENIKKLVLNKLALLLLSIKHIIIPLVAIAFFYFVPLHLDNMIIIIIILELLMPVFAVLISFSHEYKKDTSLAASLVVMSHLISAITIPIIFSLAILIFNK